MVTILYVDNGETHGLVYIPDTTLRLRDIDIIIIIGVSIIELHII